LAKQAAHHSAQPKKVEEKEVAVPAIASNMLLFLSFIEGACVMIAELGGGKMLAPFYGTSLYVWASTLSVTLGGLTAGYYAGGRLSTRPKDKARKALFVVLAVASVFVMLMPILANFIMKATLSMDFLTGLVVSQIIFLLPPIVCLGMVSPLVIGMLAEHDGSGSAAGRVYAISTMGGVIATLLTGFWLVPLIGISIPCIVIGGSLFIANALILRGRTKVIAVAVLLFAAPGVLFVRAAGAASTDKYQVLYHSEGMLGQVKVIEFKEGVRGQKHLMRSMLVNHNWQTWIDAEHPDVSYLNYTRFTRGIINNLPKDSKALLIGLGGGTVARQLEQAGVAYDAVEIDGRLPGLAQQYFGLKKKGNVVVDDGRHFVNVCKQHYDLIIIDALLGENVPSHLLSIECFEQMKRLLTATGKIFIEFDVIEKGEKGIAQKMLAYTIGKAGYRCDLFTSSPETNEADLMYVASLGASPDYNAIRIDSDYYYQYHGPMSDFRYQLTDTVAQVLTDNNPALDFYLRARMIAFRHDFLLKFNKDFMEDDMSFFY
jgi:predicted membrane-bound spermidine synthase